MSASKMSLESIGIFEYFLNGGADAVKITEADTADQQEHNYHRADGDGKIYSGFNQNLFAETV